MFIHPCPGATGTSGAILREVTGAVCLLNGNVMGELEGKPVVRVTESGRSGKRKERFLQHAFYKNGWDIP